jgi:hypothetical protein
MSQSQRLSSVIPFVTIERPACPKCKAAMMLASIEPARAGLDLHMFECAICNHELKTLAAYEDPMKSRGLGRWLQGHLHPPKLKKPPGVNRRLSINSVIFYSALNGLPRPRWCLMGRE